MKPLLVGVFFVISLPSLIAQAQQACPSGSEDMLKYFVMGYPNRLTNYMGPGNANPIYTSISPDLGSNYAISGQFLWIKSSVGFPWDIKQFDGNYIYDRTTELSWTDATAFKRFNNDLPLSARCVPSWKSGGTIKAPSSQTNYSFYGNCLPAKTQNLGYVVNTISAPDVVNIGNLMNVKVRFFTYQYSCDSNYANCAYQEVFSLGRGIGLYEGKYYLNQGGTFVLNQESVINKFDSGLATPYLPCTSSYE